MLEPKLQLLKVKDAPMEVKVGPFTFRRDEYGSWSRNRLSPGTGFRELALEDTEVLLCEEVLRLKAPTEGPGEAG